MLSLTSPLWLLGLLALPLLRRLHCFREQESPVPVAALFLWKSDDATGDRGYRARRPDPIWLLRALFLCLLLLALSGPRWLAPQRPDLTVWLDDSASMFAVEEGGTRMQQALGALHRALAAGDFGRVTLRSLGAPGQVLLLENPVRRAQLAGFSPRPRGEPQLPVPRLMAANELHWLVSDGASSGVAEWAGRAPLANRLQVGEERENLGLTALAVRREGGDGAGASVAITVHNGGERDASRQLDLYAGVRLLSSWPLSVPGGDSRVQVTTLDRVPAASLRAKLTPTDALPMDDELQLPAAALSPIVTSLSAGCGPHLLAALRSHPDLVVADEAGVRPDLRVHCGAYQPESGSPAIFLPPHPEPGGAAALPGEPVWQAEAGTLRDLVLPASSLELPAGDGPTAAVGGTVLLRAGQRPLIVHDRARQLLAVDLDFAGASLVRRPEYPLLVSALVDRVLGRDDRRDGIAAVYNNADVAIAPVPLPAAGSMSGTGEVAALLDLSTPLLLVALALLGGDLLLLLRSQRRHTARPAQHPWRP